MFSASQSARMEMDGEAGEAVEAEDEGTPSAEPERAEAAERLEAPLLSGAVSAWTVRWILGWGFLAASALL